MNTYCLPKQNLANCSFTLLYLDWFFTSLLHLLQVMKNLVLEDKKEMPPLVAIPTESKPKQKVIAMLNVFKCINYDF